ncbi:MAG: DNA repair protein RecO [Actinobacteria bacterium]|nr:DNA repair protein RecO [Actinomycetota bacterium]
MKLYREQAVVLRTVRLGEADRIVSLLTFGRGKVRAVAKGIRKTTSRVGGRLEPMSHVALQCWAGRELDVVTQVEVIDHFRLVREDLGGLSQALSMLEVSDQVAQEGQPCPQLYSMLVRALKTLASSSSPLVAPAYFWKVLALEGSLPVLDACATCGKPEEGSTTLVAFDMVQGGALCRSCRQGLAVSPDALKLVRRILNGDLSAVLAESPGPAGAEMARLAGYALEAHLDRRLKTLHYGYSLGTGASPSPACPQASL